MHIDTTAPLVARKEIIINAPIDTVWQIQTDLSAWPTWQKGISYVNVKGPIESGATFVWSVMGVTIRSTIKELTDKNVICWSGDSIGMHAIHRWIFQDLGSTTKVITEESISGWLAQIIRYLSPQFLDTSLQKALETLKHHSETITPNGS